MKSSSEFGNENIIRAFKYRIYPNKEQARLLYNLLLEKSIEAYKKEGKGILSYKLNMLVLRLRKENDLTIYSQTTQEIADRVTKSFKNFFRRVKEGKHGKAVGYPRFKSEGRYKSITFNQYPKGFKILDDNLLSVWQIGILKIKYLKDIIGRIKTLTIEKESIGNWYAVIICDNITMQREIAEDRKELVGIDIGVESTIATSEGVKVENPRILVKSEEILERRNRQLAKKKKGSNNRKKARISLAKTYKKIEHQRKTFLDRISNDLIRHYKYIAVEKLNIDNMVKNHRLAKHIMDASWFELIRMLTYKAEEAGGKVLFVNPRNTSKMCSRCKHIKENLSLKDRIFKCDNCGLIIDRDINAAINIDALGRREINACGDETNMIEKAIVSHVKEAGNLETASDCQFREY